MNKKWLAAGLGIFGLATASIVALGQSYGPPQVTSIGPNDLFQDVVNGVGQAQSYYASAPLLGNYAATIPGGNYDNALIAGDFTKNLFQRGTTTAGVTTTATYGADRWFQWAGTSTTLTGTQQTGASDVPAGYGASFRLTRTGTGVVQSCVAQEVESSGSYRFQSQTAEFSFQALAGAGFSAASSNLAVYVVTGTSTDEGSSKMAWNINAGGGGSSGWTGATVWGGTTGYLIPINTAWQRYAVEVPIPSTTKEIGVAICWTPVGTTPTNDYFEFTGAQLTVNSSLTATAGANGVALAPNDTRVKSGARRPQALETVLQQRYTYSVNEGTTTAGGDFFTGQMPSTTTCLVAVPFPVTMRAAPTYTNALTATTFKMTTAGGTATILSTPFSATTGANNASNGSVTFTSATLAGATAGFACSIVSFAGSGQLLFTAEL